MTFPLTHRSPLGLTRMRTETAQFTKGSNA
nr:MAG TPA: hypothetical protein [Caudoviricetes sp.]